MTAVDFHTVEGTDAQVRLREACALIENAYLKGQRVHVLVDDAQQATRLDELLWTYKDLAFVPHAVNPVHPEMWPVTIGIEPPAAADRPWLVNLSAAMPGYYERYVHIDEIVDDAGKQAARERYRTYRDRGADLRHFKVEGARRT